MVSVFLELPPGRRKMPLEHRLGIDIGFLQIDAPVLELLERNRCAGHCAAHERAGTDHAKVPVKIFELASPSSAGSDQSIQHAAVSGRKLRPCISGPVLIDLPMRRT